MLNHEIDGHGPPLLLIHGFGISYAIWRGVRPHLSDHFTLIMVELPGIGKSTLPPTRVSYVQAAVDGLEELRVALGWPRWNVLSYSSGTRIAEQYVNQYAGQVESAVFLCPAQVRAPSAAALRAVVQADRRSPRFGTWMLSGGRLRFLIRLLGFNLKPDPLAGEWFEGVRSQPVETLKETLRSMPRGGAAQFRLPADLPICFIWGREDLITATPRRTSQRDLIVRGAHSAPQTSPAEVAAEILRFFLAR